MYILTSGNKPLRHTGPNSYDFTDDKGSIIYCNSDAAAAGTRDFIYLLDTKGKHGEIEIVEAKGFFASKPADYKTAF